MASSSEVSHCCSRRCVLAWYLMVSQHPQHVSHVLIDQSGNLVEPSVLFGFRSMPAPLPRATLTTLFTHARGAPIACFASTASGSPHQRSLSLRSALSEPITLGCLGPLRTAHLVLRVMFRRSSPWCQTVFCLWHHSVLSLASLRIVQFSHHECYSSHWHHAPPSRAARRFVSLSAARAPP